MSNEQTPDPELAGVLRRAADHLVRRGAEYAERPVETASADGARRSGRPTQARLAGIASAGALALAVGFLALASDGATGRVEPMATADVDASTGSTIGSGIVGDTTPAPPPSTESAVDGTSTTLELPPMATVVAPPDGRPDPTTDVTVTVPDLSGPTISSVQHPAVVTAGTSFSVRWRVADADGVSSTGVTMGWASGIWTTCGFGQSGRLVSGTMTDGIWEYVCAVPASAVNTDYSLDVSAQDMMGNWSSLGGFSFTIVGGNPDSTPPAYRNVRLVSGAVVGGTLTITWTLDDPSGIDSAVMWVAGPSGGFSDLTGQRYALYETMVVTRDCSVDGSTCNLTQTVQLSPTAPAGSYALWVSATDLLGNKVLEQVLAFTVVG